MPHAELAAAAIAAEASDGRLVDLSACLRLTCLPVRCWLTTPQELLAATKEESPCVVIVLTRSNNNPYNVSTSTAGHSLAGCLLGLTLGPVGFMQHHLAAVSGWYLVG